MAKNLLGFVSDLLGQSAGVGAGTLAQYARRMSAAGPATVPMSQDTARSISTGGTSEYVQSLRAGAPTMPTAPAPMTPEAAAARMYRPGTSGYEATLNRMRQQQNLLGMEAGGMGGRPGMTMQAKAGAAAALAQPGAYAARERDILGTGDIYEDYQRRAGLAQTAEQGIAQAASDFARYVAPAQERRAGTEYAADVGLKKAELKFTAEQELLRKKHGYQLEILDKEFSQMDATQLRDFEQKMALLLKGAELRDAAQEKEFTNNLTTELYKAQLTGNSAYAQAVVQNAALQKASEYFKDKPGGMAAYDPKTAVAIGMAIMKPEELAAAFGQQTNPPAPPKVSKRKYNPETGALE